MISSISEVSRVVSVSGFENFFREGLSVAWLETVWLRVAWTGFGWSMAKWRILPSCTNTGKAQAFLLRIELILDVWKLASCLYTAQKNKNISIAIILCFNNLQSALKTHLSVIHSGRTTFSPLSSCILLLGRLVAMICVVLDRV